MPLDAMSWRTLATGARLKGLRWGSTGTLPSSRSCALAKRRGPFPGFAGRKARNSGKVAEVWRS